MSKREDKARQARRRGNVWVGTLAIGGLALPVREMRFEAGGKIDPADFSSWANFRRFCESQLFPDAASGEADAK